MLAEVRIWTSVNWKLAFVVNIYEMNDDLYIYLSSQIGSWLRRFSKVIGTEFF